MDERKIQRINELAKKAKAEGLTPAEKEEQQALRKEYLEGYRKNLRAQLDSMVVIDARGNKVPIRPKEKGQKD